MLLVNLGLLIELDSRFNILPRGLGVPLHLRSQLPHRGRSLARPIAIDDRIHNVAARPTAQTTHSHRQITLADVEQILTDHEIVASGTIHRNPPSHRVQPISPDSSHHVWNLSVQKAIVVPHEPFILLRVFEANRSVAP